MVKNRMYVVDRFEGEYAICEDAKRGITRIKCSVLPKDITEGDCIRYTNGTYVVDEEETKRRREKVKTLMDSLFEK